MHSEVTEHTARGRIMELKGLRSRKIESISAVKKTEKLRKLRVETKLVCLMF